MHWHDFPLDTYDAQLSILSKTLQSLQAPSTGINGESHSSHLQESAEPSLSDCPVAQFSIYPSQVVQVVSSSKSKLFSHFVHLHVNPSVVYSAQSVILTASHSTQNSDILGIYPS